MYTKAVSGFRLALLLLILTAGSAGAQGTVRFLNYDPDQGLDGRVWLWDGTLAGPEYVAQLLIADPWSVLHANTWDRWTPVGSPEAFRLNSAGEPTGVFLGPDLLEVPGISPGETWFACVAVWHVDAGSWEHAQRLRSWAPSNVFTVTLGDAAAPGYLVGLQPWQFLWEVPLGTYDDRPFPLSTSGHAPWPGYPRGDAWSVVRSGARAYVADQSGSLQVFDLSDATRPRWLGGCQTRGHALGLGISGSYAFVATGSPGGLEIIDVEDPAEPGPVGFVPIGAYALGVAFSGQYAYLAGGRDGLQIIDISDPAQPAVVGAYATSGLAHGVAVSGSQVYVADYPEGLAILDVSDPRQPRLMGTCATPGFARAVAVSGGHAYVADYDWGLQVVQIEEPSNPELVGTYQTPGLAYAVALDGNHAYVADGTNGLVILDITDPERPRTAGALVANGFARGIAADQGRALLAAASSGLSWIDVIDPAHPEPLSEVFLRGSVAALALSGNYTALADSRAGLQVVDLSDANRPRRAGGLPTPGPAVDVAWSGSNALVACGDGGLQVIDLSDPAAPRIQGAYAAERFRPGQVIWAEPFAYVLNGATLQVFDMADPTAPRPVGVLPGVEQFGGSWPARLAAAQGYALLTQGWEGVAVVDLRDAVNPRRVGHHDLWGQETADVALHGIHAYVLAWHAELASGYGAELHVLDLSDPTRPLRVGGCPAGAGFRLSVAGDYAYVSDALGGLRVIDVSDPVSPQAVGISRTVSTPSQVRVAGDLICVAAEGQGLVILEQTAFFETFAVDDGWLQVTWDPWPGLMLQIASDLSDPQWQDWPGSEGTNTVALPADGAARFLRLVWPPGSAFRGP